LSKLYQGLINRTANLVHRSSEKIDKMSRRQQWAIVALLVIATLGMGYGIFQASSYLEGFTKYGALGAFLVSFIASTTIFFPVFAFVIIGALVVSPATNWAVIALASSVGSALGEFTGYAVGYAGRVIISKQRSVWYQRAEVWMRRHGSLTVFIFALTPLPFDIVGLVAGALRFPFWKYLLATLAGRLPKTFVGCYLTYIGWSEMEALQLWLGGIAWWGWLLVAVGITLIIAGGVLIWLGRRRKNKQAHEQVQG
jgi:uncharacterized membrane protein YdjX (TVP38/TMEM64 family)